MYIYIHVCVYICIIHIDVDIYRHLYSDIYCYFSDGFAKNHCYFSDGFLQKTIATQVQPRNYY